jgi:ubiquinone/menaquinone biosynthesis C-methylase UbiE
MSVFRWAAPVFKWSARRWSEDDFKWLAGQLRPYVAPGGLLLDLGGGTGDLGVGVSAALDSRVVIVDATAEMLRRVAPHPSLTVRLASAEALPFPAAYFDALLCCDAFHHFRDQDAVVREMVRVVRPGGGVVVLELDVTGPFGRLLRLAERALGEPASFRTPREMEALMAPHGVAGVSTRQGGLSYAFTGSTPSRPNERGHRV